MSFGDYVRDLRIANKKTLRQFCLENKQDPSNWSKLERGINPPPKDDEVLKQWASYFGLKPSSEGWEKFMDVARISRGEIPKDIMDDEKAVSLLPAFFRTVRGADVGEDEVRKLIAKIKEANTPDDR